MNETSPWLAAVGRTLGIRAGEGGTTALLVGQAFFLGVALLTAYTPANALFLATFTADWIPYTYLAAALVVTAAGLLFLGLSRRVRLSTLLLGTFSGITAIQASLWLGLRATPSDGLVFGAMVWFRLFWVVGNLALWAMVNRLYDVRQAKRLFPLITASCVLAIILSGAAISPLVGWLGPVDLMGVSAAGLIGALALMGITARANAARLGLPERRERPRATARPASWRRYLTLMSVYTAFSTVGTYVLDYAFLGLARARYTGAEELARFFGHYLSVMTFSLLIFTALISGRIFRRFGMSSGVLANPALVAVGAVASAIAGALLGPAAPVFFVAVVATKLLDELLVPSMTTPSVRILLQPLHEDLRVRAQAVVESVVAPLSIGLAGLLLLVFARVVQLTALEAIYLLLALLVGWLLFGVRLARAYLGALRQALTDVTDTGQGIAEVTEQERRRLENELQEEQRLAAHWVATAADVDPAADDALRRCLDDERLGVVERAVRALAPSTEATLLMACLESLDDAQASQRSLAIEGLDAALPAAHRAWLMPLVRELSAVDRARALPPRLHRARLEPEQRLRQLADDERASGQTRERARQLLI